MTGRGELRHVDIAKGTTRFCTSTRIRPEAIALLAQIDRETLEQPAHERVVERVADLYAELNMVHPFREGNGRTQRLFFEQWLLTRGYAVDWQRVESAEWMEACIRAVHCDYARLAAIFSRCIQGLGDSR